MACDLNLQYNFLYRYFTCNLPEDKIDVEVTIHTLKGIHTFRKDCNTQMLHAVHGLLKVDLPIPKEENECMYCTALPTLRLLATYMFYLHKA